MFYDWRELFAQVTVKARNSRLGLWSEDTSNKYFAIDALSDVTDAHVILPKLFRWITEYIKSNGDFYPLDFLKAMEHKKEKLLILNVLHFTHFDNFLSVSKSGKLKLNFKPEDVVFLT